MTPYRHTDDSEETATTDRDPLGQTDETPVTGDDGRTDTKRFDGSEEFDATDLIVGDRIDPSLVASTMDGLGVSSSADPDAPPTQLAEATITNRMDDIHSAILVDGETGILIRASRHDSSEAWTQKEADWKVREVGATVVVSDVDVSKEGPMDDRDIEDRDDVKDFVESWAHHVLGDIANGYDDFADELSLEGSTLELYDPFEGTRVEGEIELKGRE